LSRQRQDTGRLADARHARDDDMGHVAVAGDDLEALDGLCVADNVVEEDGPVLLYPAERRQHIVNYSGLPRTGTLTKAARRWRRHWHPQRHRH